MLVGDVAVDDSLLYAIFLMYVFNTAVSYFFVCTRHRLLWLTRRITSFSSRKEGFHVVQVAVQVVILLLTGNYVLFMAITVVCTIGTNVFLAHKADKMYPFLLEKDGQTALCRRAR